MVAGAGAILNANGWTYPKVIIHLYLYSTLKSNSVVTRQFRHQSEEPSRNETIFVVLEISRKQFPAHITAGANRPAGRWSMNAAIARLLPRVSAKSVDDIESFISIALFCGVGLLLSLSVLIADQYAPGEWF